MHERLGLPRRGSPEGSLSHGAEDFKDSESRRLTVPPELITATARGRIDAFERLYTLSAPHLNRIALRITRNPALAEDVTAAALSQAWQQSDRFDPQRGSAASWLQCIVRSRAFDAIRSDKELLLHPDPWSLRPLEQDYDCDPQSLVLQSQRIRQLRDAMDTLRPEERQLLSLAFFKELTHEEIARKLGLPLGTVKSLIRRGIQHLRAALERAERRTGATRSEQTCEPCFAEASPGASGADNGNLATPVCQLRLGKRASRPSARRLCSVRTSE